MCYLSVAPNRLLHLINQLGAKPKVLCQIKKVLLSVFTMRGIDSQIFSMVRKFIGGYIIIFKGTPKRFYHASGQLPDFFYGEAFYRGLT